MKVLEKGNGIGWIATISCTGKGISNYGCGALLEIDKDDLFMVYGGDYTESIPYAAIICPECKAQTCLEDMKIKVPTEIFKNMKARQ